MKINASKLIGAHLSDPMIDSADWNGRFPLVDPDGFIEILVDEGDIKFLRLVRCRWNGRRMVEANASDAPVAYCFRSEVR